MCKHKTKVRGLRSILVPEVVSLLFHQERPEKATKHPPRLKMEKQPAQEQGDENGKRGGQNLEKSR